MARSGVVKVGDVMSIVDVIQVGGLDLCHYRREERSRDKSRRWRWAVAGPRKIQ